MARLDKELRVKQVGLIGNYFPWKMILIMGAFLAFIMHMKDELYIRFMAHPELNALIIGTMVVAIGMVFHNIYKIRVSAMFLENMEKFEDNPTEDKAMQIIGRLRKNARVIDTFYMEAAVLALKEPGSLRFTDNQSRIMKSKVGQRTSRMRHSVQYIAGVLVMLGLIGTFWGLLETITSVGEAMLAIVNSFEANSTGAGGASMVDFLKAISKPLQGMGVAFSASLFGLSGSLMTGLLNSFCAKGMDKFLEDFSNWIDARIPLADKKDTPASVEKGIAVAKPVESENQMVIKAVQEALEHFGKQTQHMFAMFSELVGELTELGTHQTQLTRQLSQDKRETMRLANTFETGMQALSTHISSMNESLVSLPVITKEMRNDVRGMSSLIGSTQQAIVSHQQLTADQIAETSRQQALLNNNLNALFEGNRALTHTHGRIAEALESLQDDTVRQKDKIIEMVLVMQHLLQSQLDSALENKPQPLLNSESGN
jgi:predicted  nucleic acid-binding Zn-ribbon protein